jgi:hypothetical protein
MQGKFLFEYAVIRVMPRVEREEFINVGIILFCARQKFLKSVFFLDEKRGKAFSAEIDLEELKENNKKLDRLIELKEKENEEETGEYTCDGCDEEETGEPYKTINKFTFCSFPCFNS